MMLFASLAKTSSLNITNLRFGVSNKQDREFPRYLTLAQFADFSKNYYKGLKGK